ncbi:MAG: UPF0149 family protein [Xanthomonadaceae bacterium]|nr:UPF0149 family protein [Xanthomonadaceae bacterium]MDP2186533.1 UPF0149 family protein [Xanthomonadales bacterium]MDZ4117070.1 UPF0149 family protein [Xanthomonadaceae bacterium]MDZ4379279.1 UPF0149 family protein [Xanthomonadaceae bacterium]
MNDTSLPTYAMVLAEIERSQLAVDASELHGSLSGFLCAGGEANHSDWLRPLALEGAAGEALQQLYRATSGQLQSPDFGFELFLPVDEQALEQRADALVAWCRGFLGGFGLVAGSSNDLTDESAEALDDLGRIASSAFTYDDPDADEAALAEVIEFVRVAALLLHGDCVLRRQTRRELH